MHRSAYEDAARFVRKYLRPDERNTVLDIGAQDINGTLRPLIDSANWRYIGADIAEGKNVDLVLSDPYHWPELQDDYFDVVLSSQVLEHVQLPWVWIHEAARVLKPGGLIYLCTPHTIHYHPYPMDCFRFWPDGLRGVVIEARCLDVLECYKNSMDTTAIARKR